MATPRGFNRGLPNRNSLTPRQQRIVAGSTQRAQQAQQRAAATNSAFPTTSAGVMAEGNRGGRALSDARLGTLTTNLQAARAAGNTNRVADLRSTLQGRRAPTASIGATRGSTALSPQRIQSLTTKLQGLKAERRGLPAPAIGSPGTLPGTGQTRQDEIYKAIRKIRGTLGGQRNAPMPLPTPRPSGEPGIPGRPFRGGFPPGDVGGVGPDGQPTPGNYVPPPRPVGEPPPGGTGGVPNQGPGQGQPGGVTANQRRIRAAVQSARGYRGRPIGR